MGRGRGKWDWVPEGPALIFIVPLMLFLALAFGVTVVSLIGPSAPRRAPATAERPLAPSELDPPETSK